MDAFLKRAKQEVKTAATPTLSDTLATPLLSEDPRVAAFYAQLNEREQIAHKIAVDKLGTSYDVTRTHGFLKWLKKQG